MRLCAALWTARCSRRRRRWRWRRRSVDLELAKRLSTSPPDTLWRGALRYRDAWKQVWRARQARFGDARLTLAARRCATEQWHARQFVLTPHALTYYKDKESKPEGRMLLAQCVALEVRFFFSLASAHARPRLATRSAHPSAFDIDVDVVGILSSASRRRRRTALRFRIVPRRRCTKALA